MAERATRRGRNFLDFQIVAIAVIGISPLADDPFSYLSVAVPALLPFFFWLRADAPGLPTLPLIGALSIIYYAIPVLRGGLAAGLPEIRSATLTVASFLVCATAAYWLMLRLAARRQAGAGSSDLVEARIVQLAFLGLASGIAFYLAFYSGLISWLGVYTGVARAVTLSLGAIGCYLVGAARARGLLRGETWIAALLCLTTIIVFSINGLLLIGGLVNVLAAILGYFVSSRRIPWVTLAVAFGLISIFQAGKGEIRAEHVESSAEVGVTELPGTMAEWFADGIDVLWTGAQQIDALERASLLWVLVEVETATPDFVPYLNGETYELLPHILLPRFIEPDKVRSQAGLNLLAMHFGWQTPDATDRTTIGFGLIAEAYANFGVPGVLVIGAIFGALCGAITWFGAGASATSGRMLMSIAATSVLLNVEADFSYLIVTMAQAVGGLLLAGAAAHLQKAVFQVPVRRRDATTARHTAIADGRKVDKHLVSVSGNQSNSRH